MIHLAREAGAQEDHTVWGSHLAPDTPQLVLAVRRYGSREQAWSLRLLGRAVARRLPDLRVSLACVGRDAPALTEVMASATSESVVVPLWLSSTERTQRTLATATALSRHSVQVAGPLGPDPLLADVLAWRLRAAGAQVGDPVVLAAPTPAESDGHLDVVRAAAMLRARWNGAPVAIAYTAGSRTHHRRRGPGPAADRGAPGGGGPVDADARHGCRVRDDAGRAGRGVRHRRAAGDAPAGPGPRRAPLPRRGRVRRSRVVAA